MDGVKLKAPTWQREALNKLKGELAGGKICRLCI